MTLRVVAGVPLALLALVTAWYDGPLFSLLWTIAAILVLREWMTLASLTDLRRSIPWALGSVAIAAAAGLADSGPGSDPRGLLIIVAGALAAGLAAPGRRIWAACGVVYAAAIAVVPIELRGSPAHGIVAIYWMFAVVWLSDVAAYFVGRAVGGPKLWPRVSPKKTWSGFIGGLVGGAGAALAVVMVARSSFGLGWYSGATLVALTLLACLASVGGDLLESALKRHFGAKDASHLIPGHGGVMDRLDSFWAVCMLMAVPLYLGGLG